MASKVFRYRDNVGGVNLISSDFRINDSEKQTDMGYIENFDIYQEGGFRAQKGNVQLNTGISDATRITGISPYLTSSGVYRVVYVKASGNAYVMDLAGGAETLIYTGLAESNPQFAQLANGLYCVDGVNVPWYYDGTTANVITLRPGAWTTTPPSRIASIRGVRLLASAGSTLYYCTLGNPLDWTGSGSGNIVDPFGDTSGVRNLTAYGASVAVHTAANRIYLFSGTEPANYAVTPIASNQSAIGSMAATTVNATQYFFTGDRIVPLVTTDLGVIRINEQVDIARKITPFFTGVDTNLPLTLALQTELSSVILLPYDTRNQAVMYVKTDPGTVYDTALLYSFDRGGWTFRKMTPVTAAASVNGRILTGTSAGQILQEFVGDTAVNVSAIPRRLVSPYFSLGSPEMEKEWLRFYMWFRTSTEISGTLTLKRNYNQRVLTTRTVTATLPSESKYGSATYGTGIYADTVNISYQIGPLGLLANSMQWELTSTTTGFDFRIPAFALEVEAIGENVP